MGTNVAVGRRISVSKLQGFFGVNMNLASKYCVKLSVISSP